ncbi:glycerate kinase [Paenibacillus cremeus]
MLLADTRRIPTRENCTGFCPQLLECRVTIACDVTNPLLGPQGASHVFGPQKGATPEQVLQFDHPMSL